MTAHRPGLTHRSVHVRPFTPAVSFAKIHDMRDRRASNQAERIATARPEGAASDGVATGTRFRLGAAQRPRLGAPIGYVLIVDDCALFADSLVRHFESKVVTVVAYSAAQALGVLDRPGLVGAIVDVRLGSHDGTTEVAIPAKRRHRDADIRVVSGDYEEEPHRKAARAGCFFMAKDGGLEPLIALAPEWGRRARRVDAVTEPIDEELAHLLYSETLTLPQVESIRMATEGLSYTEIANELGCSPQAIDGLSSRMAENTGRTLAEWAIFLCKGTVRLPPLGPSTRSSTLSSKRAGAGPSRCMTSRPACDIG